MEQIAAISDYQLLDSYQDMQLIKHSTSNMIYINKGHGSKIKSQKYTCHATAYTDWAKMVSDSMFAFSRRQLAGLRKEIEELKKDINEELPN